MRSGAIMQQDYDRIPWGLGKAYYLWLLITWIIVTWIGRRIGKPYLWNAGRRTDGEPCVCEECGWIGRIRNTVQSFDEYGEAECECPKCGKQV